MTNISFSSLVQAQQDFFTEVPEIKWPNSFQIGISTNEYGLNLTEILYYDKLNKKMRTQIFYSLMGLEPTKGLDIVIDEQNELIAFQTDNDCRKTHFKNTLFSVNILFSMFNTLTDYEGEDESGLKKFKLKQLQEGEGVPKFYFLFDENNEFTKSRISQDGVGQYDFDALLPLESKIFLEEDWYTTDNCPIIDDYIWEDSGNFASFMYSLVLNLIGGEEKIYEMLGIPSSLIPKFEGLDDEDFDE